MATMPLVALTTTASREYSGEPIIGPPQIRTVPLMLFEHAVDENFTLSSIIMQIFVIRIAAAVSFCVSGRFFPLCG